MSAATAAPRFRAVKSDRLIFKQADSDCEFEQIHRLNYQVFAEEIAQHPADGTGLLVDRLHQRSTYFIALDGERVVGMVSVHDDAPFSVEKKLSDPGILGALGERLLEVRLLAIEPGLRHRMIFGELLWNLFCHARERNYSHLIISGITEKAALYERMGFRRLGPPVVCGAASFIPMAVPLDAPAGRLARHAGIFSKRFAPAVRDRRISLMPGPVEIAEPVREAFARRPISHRGTGFIEAYEGVRATLRRLSAGMDVAVLVGTGTTANDAAALHLRAAFGQRPGLVLVNGEFGARIEAQATRAGLEFQAIRWAWGDAWDLDRIEDAMKNGVEWVWGVHLETSTGVLNCASEVVRIAQRHGVRVALDCVSSVGAVPLPEGLWLATGVSGKSVGSYAGLAFVFCGPEALRVSGQSMPASLDAAAAIAHAGPRFTVPSPLLLAAGRALALHHGSASLSASRFESLERFGRHVRTQLRAAGLEPIARECDAAPCVTSFAADADEYVSRCARAGFEAAAHTGYLRDCGWVQIATMGAVTEADLEPLWPVLSRDEA